MTYKVVVAEHPKKRLTGIRARTSMAKSAEDCPALWEEFMTSATALRGPHAYDAYGVSTDAAEDTTFTYWATLDVPAELLGHQPAWVQAASGGPRPFVPLRIEGLATIDVRAGLYAVATVPSMAALPGAYGYVYDAWPKAQMEYTVDFTAPCFELYPAAWRDGDPLRLFVPVRRRCADAE